ncbi:MAG: hypothetical protein H3C35_03535 [Bacteroidetes bacterium]|nr:hypothetical protein [Bacteroidota bacterium]
MNNPKLASLNAFRKSQRWTVVELFSLARVLQSQRVPKRVIMKRTFTAHSREIYEQLCEQHGEKCSHCSRIPPDIRLFIATKNGKPILQNMTTKETRLLCFRCSRFYLANPKKQLPKVTK